MSKLRNCDDVANTESKGHFDFPTVSGPQLALLLGHYMEVCPTVADEALCKGPLRHLDLQSDCRDDVALHAHADIITTSKTRNVTMKHIM